MSKKIFAELALIEDENHQNKWQKNVEISINDKGIIEDIKKNVEYKEAKDVQRVSYLCPSMPNAHCHAHQVAMRGNTDHFGESSNDDFWAWRKTMYGNANRLTSEDLKIVARYAYSEMAKAGYSSVGEFNYLFNQPGGNKYDNIACLPLILIEAAREIGIGINMIPALYQRGGFDLEKVAQEKIENKESFEDYYTNLNLHQRRFENTSEDFLDIISRLQVASQEDPDVGVSLAFHSIRAVTPEEFRKVVTSPRVLKKDFPIHIHISETSGEVNGSKITLKQRPVEWILGEIKKEEYKDFDPTRFVFVHSTHVTKEEIKAEIDAGVNICYCPSTEAHLGDGINDTTYYVKQGGKFSIGSDECAVINSFSELRRMEEVQRLANQKRINLGTGQDLWIKAAMGGAHANGFSCGSIAKGKRADFIVLDKDNMEIIAHKDEPNRIFDSLIFTAGLETNPVSHQMVRGKWVAVSGRNVNPGYRDSVSLDDIYKNSEGYDKSIKEEYLKIRDKLKSIDKVLEKAREGNFDLVEDFVKKYPSYVNSFDSQGFTLLHHLAVAERNKKVKPQQIEKIARLLFGVGIDIHQSASVKAGQQIGNTAFNIAAPASPVLGRLMTNKWLQDVVEGRSKKGINEPSGSCNSTLAQYIAKWSNAEEIGKQLDIAKRYGMNIAVQNANGWTPLHAACAMVNREHAVKAFSNLYNEEQLLFKTKLDKYGKPYKTKYAESDEKITYDAGLTAAGVALARLGQAKTLKSADKRQLETYADIIKCNIERVKKELSDIQENKDSNSLKREISSTEEEDYGLSATKKSKTSSEEFELEITDDEGPSTSVGRPKLETVIEKDIRQTKKRKVA